MGWVFTITLLLDLSGLTLPARVSEWHHHEPRLVGGTILAPNFARIDAERLENETCSIRRGPLGRAVVRPRWKLLPGTARGASFRRVL